jgi:hypothetical protein
MRDTRAARRFRHRPKTVRDRVRIHAKLGCRKRRRFRTRIAVRLGLIEA